MDSYLYQMSLLEREMAALWNSLVQYVHTPSFAGWTITIIVIFILIGVLSAKQR